MNCPPIACNLAINTLQKSLQFTLEAYTQTYLHVIAKNRLTYKSLYNDDQTGYKQNDANYSSGDSDTSNKANTCISAFNIIAVALSENTNKYRRKANRPTLSTIISYAVKIVDLVYKVDLSKVRQ